MAKPFLEAELNQLLAVGKITLPHLAWTYATLNNRVAHASGYDNTAFAACPATAGWSQDQLRGPWTALRDELQNILGRSARSFEAAADAMLQVAANYEATDVDAATRIRQAWRGGPPEYLLSTLTDKKLPPPPPGVIMAKK